MDNIILDRIHQVQLEIVEEIKRICIILDIDYFMLFGTLLGAVRHGGFIPWDDDLDLGMLRKDYEKFSEGFPLHCRPEFTIQTNRTDKYYGLFFMKVLRNDTVLIEEGYQDDRKINSIFVDIFPFDNAPSNRIAQIIHKKTGYFLKSLLLYKLKVVEHNDVSFLLKFLRGAKKLTSYILPRKLIILAAETVIQIVKKEGKYLTNFGDKYLYSKVYFDSFVNLKFENTYLNAPSKYEDLLTYNYGDYMQLPPKELRKPPHNIITLEIEKEKLL